MNDQNALEYFATNHWTLTTGEAVKAGMFKKDLYRLRDAGRLDEISRGVFRHADAPAVEHLDLVAVAMRAPAAVVCLSSALSYWELTDEIPRHVHLAVPRGAHAPQIEWPPTKVHAFAAATFELGQQECHLPTGEAFRIYSPERSIVDAMRLGKRAASDEDASLVRAYLRRPGSSRGDLLDMARKLRAGTRMATILRVLTA
jgi:predicted transcriptional regulator of viral defense system